MKKKTWIIILIYFLFTSCSSLMFISDMHNPCSNGGDPIECAKWKKEFPKEYKQYERRMQQHDKSGRTVKYLKRVKTN